MCDEETRTLFRDQRRREVVTTIIQTLLLTSILGVVGWGALQIYQQGKTTVAESKDRESLERQFQTHVRDFDRLIAIIPDGFFTDRTRYGQGDAYRDREKIRAERETMREELQREIDAVLKTCLSENDLLAKRTTLLEKLSTDHLSKTPQYIKMIEDTADSVRKLERIVWRLVPSEAGS